MHAIVIMHPKILMYIFVFSIRYFIILLFVLNAFKLKSAKLNITNISSITVLILPMVLD